MKILIGTLLAISVVSPATAAENSNDSGKKWLDGFYLRDQLSGKASEDTRALIQYQAGSTDSDTYKIDAAVGYVIPLDITRWAFTPYIEYHRDSQTTSPVNRFQSGISISHSPKGAEKTWLDWPDLSISGAYKDDRINTGDGLSVSVLADLDIPGLAYLGFGERVVLPKTNPWLGLDWGLVLGAEYEFGNDIAKSKMDGRAARWVGILDATIPIMLPKHKSSHYFEITVSQRYSRNFDADNNYRTLFSSYQAEFEASFNWIPKPTSDNFAVGFSYREGENPAQGRTQQEIRTLSVRLRFGAGPAK